MIEKNEPFEITGHLQRPTVAKDTDSEVKAYLDKNLKDSISKFLEEAKEEITLHINEQFKEIKLTEKRTKKEKPKTMPF